MATSAHTESNLQPELTGNVSTKELEVVECADSDQAKVSANSPGASSITLVEESYEDNESSTIEDDDCSRPEKKRKFTLPSAFSAATA